MRCLLASLALLFSLSCENVFDDTGDGDVCPEASDPCVHYISDDLDECSTLDIVCDDDQVGFTGSCGCGCLDSCR